MSRPAHAALCVAGLVLALSRPVAAWADPAPDVARLGDLVRAYPDVLAGYDGTELIWRDGTHMQADDGVPDKTEAQALRQGSILDMLRVPYPAADEGAPDGDPGRVRNEAFFDKMYGDCTKGEVAPHLVRVVWLPSTWGGTITVTDLHGVAEQLTEVSRELDALPAAEKRYLYPPGGGYLCRPVHATGAPSMHARGAAVDINPRLSDFWEWERASADGPPAYRNHIPEDIVDIFQRHGFIWGGRWSHFDTMHFEYRPELLPPVQRTAVR